MSVEQPPIELNSIPYASEVLISGKQRVVSARLGLGTFLTFDLATPSNPEPSERPNTTLWVYLCDWVLRRAGEEVCTSDFEVRESVGRFLQGMEGKELTEIRLSADKTLASLDFTDGWELELQEASDIYGAGSDMMRLFAGDKLALVVRYPEGVLATSEVLDPTAPKGMRRTPFPARGEITRVLGGKVLLDKIKFRGVTRRRYFHPRKRA